MDDPVETICYWYDGDDYHLTRCTIEISSGKPIGLPNEGEVLIIIEYEKGHEPTFYDEALITEMGIDNTF